MGFLSDCFAMATKEWNILTSLCRYFINTFVFFLYCNVSLVTLNVTSLLLQDSM